jgi:hypothetical protein
MDLNDLFLAKGVDPRQVLVVRHRPPEPKLNRVLPRLAAEEPDVFNAYQQTQGEKLERVMKALSGAGYVASFIGHAPGKALFVALYSIGSSKPLTRDEFWQVQAYADLRAKYGLKGPEEGRSSILWFDLVLREFYACWKGKLVVEWPPPELSWWRRAHRNRMPIFSILEESRLDPPMPDWHEIVLEWEELALLSPRWRSRLAEWRGIYYILDTSDGKGYVGSAYGVDNLLGRWLQYAGSGHGGNSQLRTRNPRDFRFAILERVKPDEDAEAVIQLENAWKKRLRTRAPFGLNDN